MARVGYGVGILLTQGSDIENQLQEVGSAALPRSGFSASSISMAEYHTGSSRRDVVGVAPIPDLSLPAETGFGV